MFDLNDFGQPCELLTDCPACNNGKRLQYAQAPKWCALCGRTDSEEALKEMVERAAANRAYWRPAYRHYSTDGTTVLCQHKYTSGYWHLMVFNVREVSCPQCIRILRPPLRQPNCVVHFAESGTGEPQYLCGAAKRGLPYDQWTDARDIVTCPGCMAKMPKIVLPVLPYISVVHLRKAPYAKIAECERIQPGDTIGQGSEVTCQDCLTVKREDLVHMRDIHVPTVHGVCGVNLPIRITRKVTEVTCFDCLEAMATDKITGAASAYVDKAAVENTSTSVNIHAERKSAFMAGANWHKGNTKSC